MNDQNPNPIEPPERLYELLEVLRPDVEEQGDGAQQDAAREELAELLEKHPALIEVWHEIARVDDLMAEAVQDVAVPEGLQLRILDSLQHKRRRVPGSMPITRRFFQFRWVASVLVASIAVVCIVAWWFGTPEKPEPLTENQVLMAALNCFEQEASPSAKLLTAPRTKEEQAILDRYPPPYDDIDIRQLPENATWELVDDFLGRQALVCRFKDKDGNRLALFVVPDQEEPVTGLTNRPPRHPCLMTAGRTAGAWRLDNNLYVLVSAGDETAWRSIFKPARPVT